MKPGEEGKEIVLQLKSIPLAVQPAPVSLLGMKVVDVTPELQQVFGLWHPFGVLILDPGANANRVDIGPLAAGYYFWMVGNKQIHNVREMVSEILRLQTKPQPRTGGMINEGNHGMVRMVYGYGHANLESNGTNTQYLKLTDAEEAELRRLAQSTNIESPASSAQSDENVSAGKADTANLPGGVRTLHFPNDHSMGKLYVRSSNAPYQDSLLFYEPKINPHRPPEAREWRYLAPAQGEVTVPAGMHLLLDASPVLD